MPTMKRTFTDPQFKKQLSSMSKNDIVALFAEVYNHCPQAAEYVDKKLPASRNDKALLEKYTKKIDAALFGNSDYMFDYPEDGPERANEIIKDFANEYEDECLVAELQLEFVELGLQCMINSSDVEDPLRQLVIDNFQDVCDYASADRKFLEKWDAKLQEMIDKSKELEGWDDWFPEEIQEAYDVIEDDEDSE